ncbi:MAG: hypothetical protein ACYCT1_16790 [Steroidobacteraceae bacterium]|jgi:hypothetical protein
MADAKLPSLLERHWAESALAIGAVLIAAVSLWVAYDTMHTDRMLLESSSWPYLEVYESDVLPGQAFGPSSQGVKLVVANEGIAPAKIELFEVLWKGKPQRSPWQLLASCCGVAVGAGGELPHGVSLSFSSANGVVLPAGQRIAFFAFGQPQGAAQAVEALRAHVSELSFRYCYCSVFNQCWLVDNRFGHPVFNPPQVSVCPHSPSRYETSTPT